MQLLRFLMQKLLKTQLSYNLIIFKKTTIFTMSGLITFFTRSILFTQTKRLI